MDDYDKLTPEERTVRDKIDKEREEQEQKGAIPSTHSDKRIDASAIALPYTWRQELGDVDITVPIPKGTRAKQLNVVMKQNKFTLGLKGEEPIMDGELCKAIKVDDSTWTVGEYRNRASTCDLGLNLTGKTFVSLALS